jgi:hypothetical protein
MSTTSPTNSLKGATDPEKHEIVVTGSPRSPPTEDEKSSQVGSLELQPTPSTDPNDPLNWSVLKKHLFLFIISFTAFLPDYGASAMAITVLVQPEYATSQTKNDQTY